MAAARSIEVKVGLLVLVAAGLLVALVLVMGGVHFGRRFPIAVDFNNPGGLQGGAPVKIAGVRVGQVDRLQPFPPAVPGTNRRSLVRVHIEVDEESARRPAGGDRKVIAGQAAGPWSQAEDLAVADHARDEHRAEVKRGERRNVRV